MQFIENINKYYENSNSNLIGSMVVFVKLNHGIKWNNIKNNTGDKYWYINGKIHRENDKPAIELIDGEKFWYINGKFIKQNHDSNGIIHNDKFFDGDGDEIH
jgi:hypothetical protein